MTRALAAAFVALSLADVLTTNGALAAGGVTEANPAMAYLQASLGALWWAPKLAMTVLVAWGLARSWFRWPLRTMVGLYGLIVLNNLSYLLGAA